MHHASFDSGGIREGWVQALNVDWRLQIVVTMRYGYDHRLCLGGIYQYITDQCTTRSLLVAVSIRRPRSPMQVGDLRPYLSGFFDTTSGPKVEARSYRDIALTLGVDEPSEILFATDVLGEALAAKAAGWQAVLVCRPGNKPLPAGHGFREIHTMKELIPGL